MGAVGWCWGAATIALLLWSSAAGALSRTPPEPLGDPSAEVVAVSRFEGVELVGEDSDGTLWKLRAAEGWGREGERSGVLRGVRGTLRRGEHDLVLTSERAVVDGGTAFHLADGVRIIWGGYQLRAEQASYLAGRGVVETDSAVVFTGPGLRLTGLGADLEIARRVLRVRAEVRAVFGEEER